MSEQAEAEGWGFPSNARKAHYFRAGRSLCGRYAWFSAHNDRLAVETRPSRDDCATCARQLRGVGASDAIS